MPGPEMAAAGAGGRADGGSIQAVGAGIGWIEGVGCEFEGPARGDGLQGVGDAGFDADEVAGVDVEVDPLPLGGVLREERHRARNEVERFAFALVDMVAADATGPEFQDGEVMDRFVAIAELGEFALRQEETFAGRGIGRQRDGKDRQRLDGDPS